MAPKGNLSPAARTEISAIMKETASISSSEHNTIVYRCPRTRHIMCLDTCRNRKLKKHHGCVTCTHPTKVQRDYRRMAKIHVTRITDNTKAKNPLVEIVGLGLPATKVVLTPAVARDLVNKLQAALGV